MKENKVSISKWVLVSLLVTLFVVLPAGFYAGLRAGYAKTKVIEIRGIADILPGSETKADFGVFWQAWSKLQESYLKSAEVDEEKMIWGAIRGLSEGMGDRYTTFFTPEEVKQFNEEINGEFGGIGAELEEQNGQITVVAPLKDTPAEAAGIKPKDIIAKVNGEEVFGQKLHEVIKKIKGDPGTKVKLTIIREGNGVKEIEIIREIIRIPALKWEMKPDNIGYIRIYSFNEAAFREFNQAVKDLFSGGAKGLVLDLRNNPGGYLETAVDLAGWFLPKNSLVVSERYASGEDTDFRSEGPAALKNIPVAVLVNDGSASASEILAGALRDINGVKLIGEKTFGKGTVQELQELKDGSMLKITVANWVTPSGVIIDNEGLEPDIEIKNPEIIQGEEIKDLQLEKALQVVGELIK